MVKDTCQEGIIASAILNLTSMITSFDVGRQGHKLVEPLTPKEVTQLVGFSGTDVDVADDQCVFDRVDEVLEVVGGA